MCGRYWTEADLEEKIKKVIGVPIDTLDMRRKRREQPAAVNIALGDIVPSCPALIVEKGDEGLILTQACWGYPSHKGTGLVINARAESVFEKKMFQRGIRRRRIAVPASGFYEWNKNGEKNTFRRGDGKALYMAGIADLFDEEVRFVILTTAANDSVNRVHDRMPLILEESQVRDWIFRESAAERILKQVPTRLKRQAEQLQLSLF